MKFICPLIVVEDLDRARRLYENVFNQTVKEDFGENITYEGGFSIHQKKHFQDLIDQAEIYSKSNNFELYFEENDLESLVEKLQAEGLEFVHELREQPWRQKVVRFYDYDGNMIEVGERMEHTAYRLSLEGKTIKDISRITYLPEEAVIAAIDDYIKEK